MKLSLHTSPGRRLLSVAALLAGVVFLAACGQNSGGSKTGGGGTSNTSSPLTVDKTLSNFGSVLVGSTSDAMTLTVTNSGADVATSVSATVSHGNAGDFELTSDNCSGSDLAAGSTCTLMVTFSPASEESRAATLTISADNVDAAATVILIGIGVAPGALQVTPTPWDFGSMVVDDVSVARDFTVKNTGGEPTGNLTAMLGGSDATQFTVSDDKCSGRALGPNENCTVSVTFSPDQAGSAMATLVVHGDDVGTDASASLTGNALTPAKVTATPNSHDFGQVTALTTGDDVAFTVTNSGGQATGPLSVMLGGASGPQFAISSDTCDGATLAGGSTCTIMAHFAPAGAGQMSAVLLINASPGGSALIDLTGTGTGLAISPEFVDFGSAPVFWPARASKTLTVTNPTTETSGPLSVMLDGMTPDQFTIDTTASTCDGAVLQPNDSCTVTLQFTPTLTGSLSAVLYVRGSPGGLAHANLMGDGVYPPPAFQIMPATAGFGAVSIGQTSAAQTFTLTNQGPLSGPPDVRLAGANPGDFVITANGCTAPLAPNGTCDVEVAFSPTGVGVRNVSLDITANPGGYVSASLQGTGNTLPALRTNNAAMDFGPVIRGGQSASMQATITNTWNSTIGPLTVTVPTNFTLTNDTCSGTALAGGASCVIDVRFEPSALGGVSDSVSVMSLTGGSVNTTVSGMGVPEYSFAPSSPDPFDFGDVTLGSTSSQTFTLTNNAGVGEQTRTINLVTSGSDFSLDLSGTCSQGLVLMPGDSCDFDVVFDPASGSGTTGTKSGSVDVTDNQGGTGTRNLTGNAL